MILIFFATGFGCCDLIEVLETAGGAALRFE
jgi:hypothetical protein